MSSTPSRFRARVGPHNGAPTVFVNDKPIFLDPPYLEKAPYEHFEGAGVDVYFLYDHYFTVNPDNTVDMTEVESEIDELLAKEPNVPMILRTFPPDPLWWRKQNPEELIQYDGSAEGVSLYWGVNYDASADDRHSSWASDAWVEAACSWYKTWCGNLHKRYGGQVIGYQFGMGACGENQINGSPSFDGRWLCHDFSKPMLKWFRNYLTQKYGSDAALQKAWSMPDVTLATAQIPSRMERLRTDWFTFRDPLHAQVSDYYLAYSERVQEICIRFARAIKEATNNETLVGTHLGCLMDTGYHSMIYHQTSTNIFHRALKDPAIDLFTSPASYINRDPGGDANSMMPAGSYVLNNKMIFQDQDDKTSVLPPGFREGFIWGGEFAKDLEESEHLLKRNAAHAIIRGYGFWWHAMVKGMFGDPYINQCIRRITEIGQASLKFPRGVAEDAMAMIVDEQSLYYQEASNHLLWPMLYYQRQYYWSRSGVAWNAFLHDDLNHPQFPKHKVYYFLNTFFLTDAEMETIQRKLRGSGATVIWTYAPGIQSPAGFDLERASRLCGFRLRAADIEALPLVTLTNKTHPYVAGTSKAMDSVATDDQYYYSMGKQAPVFFGTGKMNVDERAQIGPMIYVDDPDATVLGVISILEQPGFCVKEMDGWTSVYNAAPMLNQYLMRNIARTAGMHIWSDGDDVVLPGKSFVMIHTELGGEKVINLPAPTDVYECYDRRLIGKNMTEIRATMKSHDTALYFLGSPEQYESALRK